MSIEQMLAEHPHVKPETDNVPLRTAVRDLMVCAAVCNSCADACVAEPMDMRQCIRLCLDCADIGTATARMAVVGSLKLRTWIGDWRILPRASPVAVPRSG